MNEQPPLNSSEQLITEAELMAAIRLPNVHAVRLLRYKKKIPYVKMGHRTIRYSLPKVLKALEKLEVKEAGAAR